MASPWQHVEEVLRQSDIVLEVLDARMIEESRNPKVEARVRKLGKKLLYVFNKCDLAELRRLQEIKKKFTPSVFISSTQKLGTSMLRKKIFQMASHRPVIVGVVGYPNVGKSTLINTLAGRSAARTSPESGFTKGLQRIRMSRNIVLLDTPGVFPSRRRQETITLGKMGAVDYAKIKEPELVALQLIREERQRIEEFYGVACGVAGHGETGHRGSDYGMAGDEPADAEVGDAESSGTAEALLDALALKYRKLRKGGNPDWEAAARMLIRDWQSGKLFKRQLKKLNRDVKFNRDVA